MPRKPRPSTPITVVVELPAAETQGQLDERIARFLLALTEPEERDQQTTLD